MTGALWTPLQPLVSATLPNLPLHPLEVPPALGFWIPFLASILHQHLNPPIPTRSQAGGSIRNAVQMNMDLAPESSATNNHLATPPEVEVNTKWLHLPESLDDAILMGHGVASGYRQQPNQPTNMAKFKVTRPDMTLELKLKGLNLETWDSLKQFINIHEGTPFASPTSKIVIYDDSGLDSEGGEA
ncbi:hypothetical protein AAC387_Pa07g0006 [Persea americana]